MGPFDPTRHHRNPESNGGDWSDRNISKVCRYKHEAWHLLFDNLLMPKMFICFLFFFKIFGACDVTSNKQKRIIRNWIGTSKPRAKKYQAWLSLFQGLSIEGIIVEINQVWIDPDYELKISVSLIKKAKKTFVETKNVEIKKKP